MNVDPDSLGTTLRRLVARQDHDPGRDLLGALDEVVHACADLFAVTGSGVMLADDVNALRYVAASGGQGRLLERAEAAVMQGPCTEAFVLDRTTTSDDVRADERWPAFRALVEREPELRAVLGAPVKLGAVTVGTLDVFRDRPHAWTDAERDAVVRYADVVAANLSIALAAHLATEQVAQLQYALDYRVVIERGVGYLMARDGLDVVTAFNRLRSAARSTRSKIGTVAQHLLDTGDLPRHQV